MHKIGIITMYYKSHNYGGLLQAYALQKVLSNHGYDAEQICYKRDSLYSFTGRIKKFIRSILFYFRDIHYYNKSNFCRNVKIRNKRLEKFGLENIKHSKFIYSDKNLKDSNEVYSTFITGSDQVWANNISAYYLDFVDPQKRKISYGASIAKEELTDEEKRHFETCIPTFSAVSVRENRAAELIKPCCSDKKIQIVLDPTMLLEIRDWDGICSPRLLKDKYIFCYFLSSDPEIRKIARDFVDNRKLILCNIPHLHGTLEKNDLQFADKEFMYADPSDFISLIKYSEAVFTDSFHASVFSCIYNKPFVVFDRVGHIQMHSRIKTLLDIYGCPGKFIKNANDITSLSDIDQPLLMSIHPEKFEEVKRNSLSFLLDSVR